MSQTGQKRRFCHLRRMSAFPPIATGKRTRDGPRVDLEIGAGKLITEGVDAAAIDRVKAPADLDLGAITLEAIAKSILAEITVERRRGQRGNRTGLRASYPSPLG